MAPVKGSTQPNRAKPTIDTNAPKRPVSSYFLWLQENRDKLQNELGTGQAAKFAPFASERWKTLPREEREPFEKMGKDAARKYQTKLDKYKASSEYAEFKKGKSMRAMEARRNIANGVGPLNNSSAAEATASVAWAAPARISARTVNGSTKRRAQMQDSSSEDDVGLMISTKTLPRSNKNRAQVQDSTPEEEPCTSKEPAPKTLHSSNKNKPQVQDATSEEEPRTNKVLEPKTLHTSNKNRPQVQDSTSKEEPCTSNLTEPKNLHSSNRNRAQVQDSTSKEEPRTSKVLQPISKRRYMDNDDDKLLAKAQQEVFMAGSAASMSSIVDTGIKAIQSSRRGSCKPLIVEPVEVFEAPAIKRDPPVFDRWWMKRRSIFVARLSADATDVQIEAEARRCWDLLTDDLRRTFDLPMQVKGWSATSATSASHENREDVIEPGPPGLCRWLGHSGRRRKRIRIQAMFLPLYNDDGSFVPYAARKRSEALRLWGNVSDKRRAKYAKTNKAQPVHS